MNASKKFALVAAVAAGGFLAAGAAQARADVSWSVTIGGGAPVYDAPVYQPAPVFQPAPVYAPAPAVVLPAPVIGLPLPRVVVPSPRVVYPVRYDRDHDGIPDRYDHYDNRRGHGWERDGRGWERDGRRWDSDGDGVPNGRDRWDHNPRRW
jgi:hypothetical protein